MVAIPTWFIKEWTRNALQVQWAGRTHRAVGWQKRRVAREYWTYLAVESGRLHVSQTDWRETLATGEQVLLSPGWSVTLAARAETSFVSADFFVLVGHRSADPLHRLGLPVKIATASPEYWQALCTRLADLPDQWPHRSEGISLQARPVVDALVSGYLSDGFEAGAFVEQAERRMPKWILALRNAMYRPGALRDMTVQRLVAMSGYSHSHVGQQFIRRFGKSPSQMLLEMRLDVAARRLDSTSTPVSEIARDLGFSSHTRFSLFFRRAFGFTPTAWRRRGTDVVDGNSHAE